MARRPTQKSERTQAELAVCEILSGALSSAVLSMTAALAERLEMNVSDFKCLSILGAMGPMTAGRLAGLAGMSTAQTTLVVDRLERAGLVRRVRDPEDKRRTVVHPIEDPALSGTLEQVFDDLAREMGEAMAPFDTKELRRFAELLQKASGVLDAVGRRLRAGAVSPPGGRAR